MNNAKAPKIITGTYFHIFFLHNVNRFFGADGGEVGYNKSKNLTYFQRMTGRMRQSAAHSGSKSANEIPEC